MYNKTRGFVDTVKTSFHPSLKICEIFWFITSISIRKRVSHLGEYPAVLQILFSDAANLRKPQKTSKSEVFSQDPKNQLLPVLACRRSKVPFSVLQSSKLTRNINEKEVSVFKPTSRVSKPYPIRPRGGSGSPWNRRFPVSWQGCVSTQNSSARGNWFWRLWRFPEKVNKSRRNYKKLWNLTNNRFSSGPDLKMCSHWLSSNVILP